MSSKKWYRSLELPLIKHVLSLWHRLVLSLFLGADWKSSNLEPSRGRNTSVPVRSKDGTVAIATINHPFFDGLYHPFMVMNGVWFIIAIATLLWYWMVLVCMSYGHPFHYSHYGCVATSIHRWPSRPSQPPKPLPSCISFNCDRVEVAERFAPASWETPRRNPKITPQKNTFNKP